MKGLFASVVVWLGLVLNALAQAPPPVPALPDSARLTSYSIVSSTCACSVGFQIYGSGTDVDEWIQVYVNGIAYLSTDLMFGWSLSSVSPGGLTGPRPITNAILTFNAAQTGTVLIVGAERPRRLSQFSENRGVPARDLNQAISDTVAVQRELWDKSNRSIVGQPGEVLGALPSAAARANLILGFGNTGQPVAIAISNTLTTNSPNVWTGLQTFNGGIAGSGPIGMINTVTPATFATPGYSFNDNGVVGLSFSDTSTHLAFAIGGNMPATGTGSYAGLNVTQFGLGRDVSAFVTGALMNAIAIGGGGNYSGGNPYVVVCGTAVIAGQCPLGTAATLQSAVGIEVDIFSFAGATMLYKEGLRIADLGVIQASGANNLSAGISIARISTAPGFVYGIYFGDPSLGDASFPLTTTGAAMKLSTTASAIDSIIDGSGLAGGVTNGAIRLPNGVAGIKWTSWSLQETSGLIAFQTSGGLNAALFQATATTFSGTVLSGNQGTNAGAFLIQGLTSGTVTIQPGNANAGTFNFNLPVTVGAANSLLTSQGGGSTAMTWTSPTVTVNTVACTLGSSCTIAAASALVVGTSTITGGACTSGFNLFNNAGVLGCQANGSGVSLTVGTTTVAAGTTQQILYDNGGTLGEITKGNNCVYTTNGTGVPSCGTTLGSAVTASSLTSVGTLTGGATGAGFTVALGTSTVTGQLPVANGGTGLASGTSGGILAFTGATTIASSAALGANCIVYGGGAGVVPATSTSNCPTVSLAGAISAFNTFVVTTPNVAAVQTLSGSLAAFSIMSVGRLGAEFEFGVAGASGNFFSQTAAGDSVIFSTGNLFIGYGGDPSAKNIFFMANSHVTPSQIGGEMFASGGWYFGASPSDPGLNNVSVQGLVILPNLTTDTSATSTRTVCQNVTGTGTTNALYFGSGSGGICKGTSARFMKQDIEPIMYGLQEVMKTSVHSFYWRPGFGHDGDLKHQQVGFIADEVGSSMPLFTTKNSQGIDTSVDYMGAMLVLFRSVQQIVETCDTAVNDNFCVELKRKLAR